MRLGNKKRASDLYFRNKDENGKILFDKALNHYLNNEFEFAYETFKIIINTVNCDDFQNDKINRIDFNIEPDLKDKHHLFCYAYFALYQFDEKILQKANDYLIEFYYHDRIYYGYYLGARFSEVFGDYTDALSIYHNMLELEKRIPLFLYRMGKINEINLNCFGLDRIFESFVLNPTSIVVNFTLKEITSSRINHPLKNISYEENELIESFMNDEVSDFNEKFVQLLIYSTLENDIYFSNTLADYINFLLSNDFCFSYSYYFDLSESQKEREVSSGYMPKGYNPFRGSYEDYIEELKQSILFD